MGVLSDIVKKIPKLRAALITVSLTSIGGILGWLGTSTLKNLEEVERMAIEARARIERLENDDAKWGTLAEQQKQLMGLAVEVEVLKRLSQLNLATARPTGSSLRLPNSESSPTPRSSSVSPPAPGAKSPPSSAELLPNVDVDRKEVDKFKNMQQSKWPDKR